MTRHKPAGDLLDLSTFYEIKFFLARKNIAQGENFDRNWTTKS